MKTFKTLINQISGLRFVYEHLKIASGVGRKRILNQPFIKDEFVLRMEFDLLEEVNRFVLENENGSLIPDLQTQLGQLKDISQTLANLMNEQVLDDIQLFEIKKLSLISRQISQLLQQANFDILPFHDLMEVIDLLDPEKTRIAHFYIYAAYDPRLASLRRKTDETAGTSENEKYRWEAMQIEDRIRQKLSKQLLQFGRQIQQNLDQLAYLDVLIAKSIQKKEWELCKPEIGSGKTVYQKLFNPAVQSALNDLGRTHKFQPVDIELFSAPTLITGANMSGKTVLLKTVALAQYLFQYGFYIPASKAVIMPVEEIMFSIGDQQSEMNGLSSFAVEILNVNKIMVQARKGKKILALVDELARTTNPEEGKAMVSAFIEMMTRYQVNALITSHYSAIEASCRRLRVKGLAIHQADVKITPENIADYMDYSLLETDSDEVPMEGMTIAEIFDIDPEFLALARQIIQR